jgi:hypothetical protein
MDPTTRESRCPSSSSPRSPQALKIDDARLKLEINATDGDGGVQLFLESAEPSFDELPLAGLLDRWPAGKYKVRGRGREGQKYVGSARLSHHLPDGPELVSSLAGDGRQDPADTVLRWRRVPPADGSPIIGYQVIVVAETGLRALPTKPSTS